VLPPSLGAEFGRYFGRNTPHSGFVFSDSIFYRTASDDSASSMQEEPPDVAPMGLVLRSKDLVMLPPLDGSETYTISQTGW